MDTSQARMSIAHPPLQPNGKRLLNHQCTFIPERSTSTDHKKWDAMTLVNRVPLGTIFVWLRTPLKDPSKGTFPPGLTLFIFVPALGTPKKAQFL